MERIIATHAELERLDLAKLQRAKRLKAPVTEKQFGQPCAEIPLQVPDFHPQGTLGDLLNMRTSVRDYTGEPISYTALSTILHYSYGTKDVRSNVYHRSRYPVSFSPSAGGLQPFDVYVFVSNVEGLEPGLYYYSPGKDSLLQMYGGMPHIDLANCYVTEFPLYAAANVVIVGDVKRFAWKYAYRGYRLLNVDCGILAENMTLLAVSQNVGSCMIAAFSNEGVAEALQLSAEELPLLCLSFGVGNE